MAKTLSTLVIVIGLFSAAGTLAQTAPESFPNWLQKLEAEAIAAGIAPETVHTALDHAMIDERVVALDQKQPETTTTFDTYSQHIVSIDRINQGSELLDTNAALLANIYARYGVPPEIIVALWGMESSFGRNSGDYSIINSLVTLAYEGRRASFFRKELIDALRILDLAGTVLRGSRTRTILTEPRAHGKTGTEIIAALRMQAGRRQAEKQDRSGNQRRWTHSFRVRGPVS